MRDGGACSLPPQKMIARLPPDGIVMAVVQYVDNCRPLRGLAALRPPLNVADAHRRTQALNRQGITRGRGATGR